MSVYKEEVAYQESKIEPITAVDKVLHCGLVNIQSVGNKTINIRNLINVQVNIGTGLRRRGRFLNNFSGRINSAY